MALLQDARDHVDRAFGVGDPRGLDMENAFGGATSMFRRRYAKDLSGFDLAITGVPFDGAVTHRPGARFGPRAMREASALQVFDPPWGWDGYSPLEALAIADHGDVGFDYARVPDFPQALRGHVRGILSQGAGCIAMGGDHSVTLPILEAHAEAHGPLALVQFDAHSDTWPDADETRIDHGTMFGKGIRSGVIDAARSVAVGIRTVNDDPMGVETISALEVHEAGVAAVAARVRDRVGDRPAYVTFDIDCLDPAFAPGTGTPVWGGLASWQAQALLRALAGLDVVGGDVVEVAPAYDPSGATAIAGAHAVMELICLWGWTRR